MTRKPCPTCLAAEVFAGVAQLVERGLCKSRVAGSSPVTSSIFLQRMRYMSEKEEVVFRRIRKKVSDHIRNCLDRGQLHRSSEGVWETLVSYPSFFEDASEYAPPDYYQIDLFCSLFGSYGQYSWSGSSWAQVLYKCERDVDKMLKEEIER